MALGGGGEVAVKLWKGKEPQGGKRKKKLAMRDRRMSRDLGRMGRAKSKVNEQDWGAFLTR